MLHWGTPLQYAKPVAEDYRTVPTHAFHGALFQLLSTGWGASKLTTVFAHHFLSFKVSSMGFAPATWDTGIVCHSHGLILLEAMPLLDKLGL